MPYFSGPNGIREVADAGDRFQQSFQDSRRKRLLSDYFATGNADLGQLAKYDPEAAQQIQAQQKQSGLAALLGQAYAAPDDQRQGVLAKLMGLDPKMGMDAAKMMDPRFAGADGGVPSQYQVFDRLAKDGNLSAEERATAARRQLYLDPRPSNAAISYQKVTGADGRERLVAVDPRQVGALDMSTGQAFGSGVGQGQPSAPAPSRNDMEADIALANQMVAAGIPAEQVDAFIAARGQRANAPASMPAGGAQFASQTPGEKAYETEDATQRAKLSYLPQIGQIEAGNAGLRETATVTARTMAERQGKQATARLDAMDSIGLLDGAEELLKRATGGRIGAATDSILGAFNQTTEGSRATAGLKVISAKLVGKVPRFEGPQSNFDVQLYREAAGDLANDNLPVGQRLAALQEMRRLAQKAAGQQRGARPQAISTQAQYDALPSGAIYIEDGQQYRKP